MRVRWFIREVQENSNLVSHFCLKVLVHDAKNFMKTFSASMFANFGGPAGGSAPGKVLRPLWQGLFIKLMLINFSGGCSCYCEAFHEKYAVDKDERDVLC